MSLVEKLLVIIDHEQTTMPIARLDTATGDIGPGGMRRRIIRTVAMTLLGASTLDRNALAERVVTDLEDAGFVITRKAAP